MKKYLLFIPIAGFLFISSAPLPVSWQELETGLEYASISSPIKSSVGDSKIEVLRINPAYFKFNLLCAGEKKSDNKPLNEWCNQYKMIAGVNSSMYKLDGDYATSTGYMKNYNYTNNAVLNSSYNNVFVFNGKEGQAKDARIADLRCEDWNTVKNNYNSFSQSIRMLDCESKNTWQLQEKKWSMVLLGEDKNGNILFIFSRSPYRVRDFISILTGLPLQLHRLMYLEGGPEASFCINHPKLRVEKFGSYETGFNENDNNRQFWNIPNVIGISRK